MRVSMSKKKKRTMDPLGKRAVIMARGEALFAQNGYQNTTVADIARAADVAVGTLYRLFPDKLSLLAALHQAMENAFIDVMRAAWRNEPDYGDKFDAMVAAIFNKAEESQSIMPLYNLTSDLVGVSGYTPGVAMIDTIAAQYGEGVSDGAFIAHNLHIAAATAHGMVEGAMKHWASNPSDAGKQAAIALVSSSMRRAFLRGP
jgi:AcrR family transcriptional regulator